MQRVTLIQGLMRGASGSDGGHARVAGIGIGVAQDIRPHGQLRPGRVRGADAAALAGATPFSGRYSAGPPRTRCHRILRAGLASQVVHSGRYPCRLQNGTDNGLTCS